MLKSIPNSSTRSFSLDYISPDGKAGCLIPATAIKCYHPIAVSQYDDGVLCIGTIRIDTKRIMSGLNSYGITATVFKDGIVGISMHMFGARDSASVYFEYKYGKSVQKPLYRVIGSCRTEHSFICELKPFAKFGLEQKIAKVLSFGSVYPCVTV